MSSANLQPVNRTVHRWAVLTCCVALLPITIGSLVTTLKAGMAFADWPTSDGHNMLLYPLLNDLRHTDRFAEHSHRLAGVLIGLVSIGLVVVVYLKERRTWVRGMAIAILIAVIAQGLLGGMRVRLNEQVLAMTHSVTGALFFTLTFVFAGLTRSRRDGHPDSQTSDHRLSVVAMGLGLLLPLVVLTQYLLGGLFRHFGRMLLEHVAGAVIVTLLVVTVVFLFRRSQLAVLKRAAAMVGGALLIQIGLGLGAWVTKLGFAPLGWVATVNSPAQNLVCTLHTVGGMFLLATSFYLAVQLYLQAAAGRIESVADVFSGSPGSASSARSAKSPMTAAAKLTEGLPSGTGGFA